ncbi:MAG: hypothetical protein COV30_00780 [Candidatus Yanofskybacteria bacterium CG10_big_fil_rev_8_21_14_0_10_37_15]|uniref:Serine protease n=1 Tax=Candidatus Yanofskybacteria bacterium CG10_big_fil_rev_8_21_14_0_10_37_15 TaxID=1975097 RepID=A0A2H0R642_9BACT|nr:MAG: hypothetical protein COV30_00780 [Candidatus Yanofskybacteria bacterium CG10_big_fil_rev_8_21_14_0_10_37_15]
MFRSSVLFLIFALLHSFIPATSQNQRRIERMIGLGDVIIADAPLPDKVFQAQKHKLIVQVKLTAKNDPTFTQTSSGTGTIIGAGIIITNRHVLETAKIAMEGRVHSSDFSGIILAETSAIEIPLSLAGVGEIGTFKDFMVLKTNVEVLQRAIQPSTPANPNPYEILFNNQMKLIKKSEIGEKIYLTGYSPIVGEITDSNGYKSGAYIDIINFTFVAEILAKIEDMPINKLGKLKRLYRLKDGAEPGYSGGMALNESGYLVGIMVSLSPAQNFVYILSSEDLIDFLKENNLKIS